MRLQEEKIVPKSPPLLLLYDGECGFCNSSVQFILRNEKNESKGLLFAALQGETAKELLLKYPHLSTVDSLLLVENYNSPYERVRIYSQAALSVGIYLGGKYLWAARLAGIIPLRVRDAVYKLIARYRKQLIPLKEECLLLSPDERLRFLP